MYLHQNNTTVYSYGKDDEGQKCFEVPWHSQQQQMYGGNVATNIFATISVLNKLTEPLSVFFLKKKSFFVISTIWEQLWGKENYNDSKLEKS